LSKKDGPRRILKAKHFIYDLVEDKNIQKKPPLEVVLTQYVEGIGEKGDVVAIPRTQAYNKLLLPGLAVYKTEENMKKYSKDEKDIVEQTHSSPYAQRVMWSIRIIYGYLNIELLSDRQHD
jgi:large subunit ribosomal protein L9